MLVIVCLFVCLSERTCVLSYFFTSGDSSPHSGNSERFNMVYACWRHMSKLSHNVPIIRRVLAFEKRPSARRSASVVSSSETGGPSIEFGPHMSSTAPREEIMNERRRKKGDKCDSRKKTEALGQSLYEWQAVDTISCE